MKGMKENINRRRDIYHVIELEASILWNEYDSNQPTDSMHCLSNYQWHFLQSENKNFTISIETQKTLNSQSNHKKKKWNSVTSDYTIKL